MSARSVPYRVLGMTLLCSATSACGDEFSAGEEVSIASFAFRRAISIDAATGLDAGYQLFFELDHATLATDRKARVDGGDVRVFYDGGAEPVEIARVLDVASRWESAITRLWFKTQAPLAAPGNSNEYAVYYGAPNLEPPSADPSAVFDFWDDFSTQLSGWSTAAIGDDAQGSATISGGRLRLEGASGDIWGQADSCVFHYREVSFDFTAEAAVTAAGDALADWAHVGGVMVRSSLDPGARNRKVGPVWSAVGESSSWRLAEGGLTADQHNPGTASYPEYASVDVLGAQSRATISRDGLSWMPLGGNQVFEAPGTDLWLVGVPLSSYFSGAAWVETEWFRIRRYTRPPPVASLGPEQTL